MDTTFFFLIHRELAAPWLDPFMVWWSRWWFTGMGVILVLDARRERQRLLLVLTAALVALGTADLFGAILKDFFGRVRPCEALDGVRQLMGCGHSGSFPSNHTAAAFAVATVLACALSRPTKMVAFVMAALVGWSRIYVGTHYPGDVLGGVLLGAGIGVVIARSVIPSLEDLYERNPERVFLGLGLFCLTVFRLVYVARGPLDLTGDEAHYWEWSRRLDLSYYSKGPFVAYWIRLFTALLGDSELAIRSGAALLSLGTSVLVFDLTRRLCQSEKAGLWAVLLFQCTPVFFVYGVVMTIDPPFVFFWTLAFWIFLRILETDGHALRLWAVLGAAFGLGLLAKFTMGLFAGCAFLFLLLDPARRRMILGPGPFLAGLVALIFFSPVLVWNVGHDWVTFRHTAGHVALDEGFRISFLTGLNFVGGQLGVIGPLLLPVLLWALWRQEKGFNKRLIATFTLPVLCFFLVKSFQAKVQGNWSLPGYILLYLPLGALAASSEAPKARRWVLGAGFLSLLMTLLMLSPNTVHRLGFRISGQDKMIGWQELGRRVGRMRDEMPDPEHVLFASDYYMIASELAFYIPGNPTTFAIHFGDRRMNQYDLWPGPGPAEAGRDGLFVIMGRSGVPPAVAAAFTSTRHVQIDVGTENVRRWFTVIQGFGFRGFPAREVHSY